MGTPWAADEERRREEAEREDERTLLDFCITEDEYRETLRGDAPPQVYARRDRYFNRRAGRDEGGG